MTVSGNRRADDAVEACADALLCAAAASLPEGTELDDVITRAMEAIGVVLERTYVEGPKPR